MSKTPDNFAKKIKKLDNYFILHEEDKYFIISTKITIKEHIEKHYTFSTYAANRNKDCNVFFILGLAEDCAEFEKFRKKEIPILVLPKNIATCKADTIKEYLDTFVKMKF